MLYFGLSNGIFVFNAYFLVISLTAIILLSSFLFFDSGRILEEAYEMENFFVRSKKDVLLSVLPLFFESTTATDSEQGK